ncbi:MAG: hypothetical protein IJO52_05465 [Clostridia bacterium]|nr:hypothetical protein [Clostridia bacterium]
MKLFQRYGNSENDRRCTVLHAVKYTAVFVITLIVLWLMLTASALIPNDAIRSNYEKSVYYYSDKDAFEFTSGKKLSAIADNYADAIWLNVAWNMGEGNPVISSVRTSYHNGGEFGVNSGLYFTVINGAQPNTEYNRYWHGTAMLIRVLHLFTDVSGIKIIGFAVFIAFLVFSVLIIAKKHHDIALILVLSAAAVQIWNIRLSIEYQPSFLIAFMLIPLYVTFERKGDGYVKILSIISGVSVAFFDFLTTETVTVLLPLAVVLAVRAKEKRLGAPKDAFELTIKCGILWLAAYTGAFLIKWAAASCVAGTNVFEAAAQSAAVHLIGGNTAGIDINNRPKSFISCIFANLTVLFGGTERVQYVRVAAGCVICFAVIFSVWYLFHKKQENGNITLLLGILGAVVFVRFLVLSNHSYVHEFFVYRALITPIFSLLTSVWLSVRGGEKRRRQ